MQSILQLERQIQEIYDNSERMGEFGDVDGSYELLAKADELRKEQEHLIYPKEEKRTMVCDVSGNLMSTKVRKYCNEIFFLEFARTKLLFYIATGQR